MPDKPKKGSFRKPYPARKGGAADRTEEDTPGQARDRDDAEKARKRVRST